MWKKLMIIGGGIVAALIVVLYVFRVANPIQNHPPGTNEISTDKAAIRETADPQMMTTDERTVTPTVSPTETAFTPFTTATPSPWHDTVFGATCEEAGYIVHENVKEGITTILEGEAPLGHSWSEWKREPESDLYISTCTRCGKTITRTSVYTESIPRIDFTGSMEGIGKGDRVTLKFDFASPQETFSCYSYTTWQGHSSLDYPKKNYTIRLYDDEEITMKHRLSFPNWQREHKYVLKANYHDVSQMRNLIAADLWADMVACRANLYEPLRKTSHYGTIDGFPVIVYLNNDFIGLYTMNLHVDDDLFQMKDAYDAIMKVNQTEPEECRFYKEAAFTDEKHAWEVEFCGTWNNNQWAKDKLNELIHFVIISEDVDFQSHLGDYADVDGLIDYLIFLYVTGLKENASKDLILLKYHDCEHWIPTVYDLEHAFGLKLDGSGIIGTEVFLPNQQNGQWNSATESLLWDRLINAFTERIKERYAELRQSVLTVESLEKKVQDLQAKIPKDYYTKDLALYPRKEMSERTDEQMIDYYRQRLLMLDGLWLKDSVDTI